MRNTIFICVAVAVLIVGLAFSLSPIPLGTPLVALALVILIATNRLAARSLIVARMRVGPLDRLIGWLEYRSGTRLGRILRRTRPQRIPRRA